MLNSPFVKFLKDWSLPISMMVGVAAYFIFAALPLEAQSRKCVADAVAVIQPMLLFFILYLSFCKVDPRELRIKRWHLRLILLQVALAGTFALAIIVFRPPLPVEILLASAFLCFICPTAAAAVVVTNKLGGDVPSTVTYTITINFVTALVASIFIPLINPDGGISFANAFGAMIWKVFSILVVPMLLAVATRFAAPKFLAKLLSVKDLPFYIWIVSLALALSVTTRSIVHSRTPWYWIAAMGLVTFVCCFFQFWAGHRTGVRFGDRTTAGQVLGQKNTVFIIWMASTFMNPLMSVVGGLYSIAHNLVNSRQLYKHSHNQD
ncbi:MAG: transporter [Bacteroidales bacterium]|nr:transporter [Bacteroidales bacterium]